jgi:hypothetical protein
VADEDDDQLFYTKAYLDQKFRKNHSFALDHNSTLFLNLKLGLGKELVEYVLVLKRIFKQLASKGSRCLIV